MNINTENYRAIRIGPPMTMLSELELLPGLIRSYLFDDSYPFADNSAELVAVCRRRLKKLIYWDGADPLSRPEPSSAQIQGLIYDPANPVNPTDGTRGYRIFTQRRVPATETLGRSAISIYNGGAVSDTAGFTANQELVIQVLVSNAIEANISNDCASRSYLIAQCIVQMLAEISLGGLEPFRFKRMDSVEDGKGCSGYVLRFSLPDCV